MGHNSAARLRRGPQRRDVKMGSFREPLPPLTCLWKSHRPCFIRSVPCHQAVLEPCLWNFPVTQNSVGLLYMYRDQASSSFKEPGASGDCHILQNLRTTILGLVALTSYAAHWFSPLSGITWVTLKSHVHGPRMRNWDGWGWVSVPSQKLPSYWNLQPRLRTTDSERVLCDYISTHVVCICLLVSFPHHTVQILRAALCAQKLAQGLHCLRGSRHAG